MADSPKTTLAVMVVLFIAVILTFQPAFEAGFVNWDDDLNFERNFAFRGLGAENIQWMFGSSHHGHWTPLTWLTFAIEHKIAGLCAPSFHRTNVFLHAAVACTFYFVALTLLSSRLYALIAALLFALHPLRCESVCWITERRDLLSALFFLLACLAWIASRGANSGRRALFVGLALFAQTFSLLSKAWAMVLPAVLFLLDQFLRRTHEDVPRQQSPLRRQLREWLPFVGLSVIGAGMALWAQREAGTTLKSLEDHSILGRCVQAMYGLVWYPWKTIWPSQLLPIHELPIPFEATELRFLAAGVVCCMIAISLVIFRLRFRALTTGILIYGVLILPVLGFVQAGPQLVADRYAYLAGWPFAILAAGALQRLARLRFVGATAIKALSVTLICGLAFLSWKQCHIWKDSNSLWTWTLKHHPDSAIAATNLGQLRADEAKTQTEPGQKLRLLRIARNYFERAAEIRNTPALLINLGVLDGAEANLLADDRQVLLARAEQRIRLGVGRAFAEGFVDPIWRMNLGVILHQQGRREEALTEYRDVIARKPNEVQGRRLIGIVLSELGRTEEALEHIDYALRLQPQDLNLWLLAGEAFSALNNLEGAIHSYRRLLEFAAAKHGDVQQLLPESRVAAERLKLLQAPKAPK